MKYNYEKKLMQIKSNFIVKVDLFKNLKKEICHTVGQFYSTQNAQNGVNRFTVYDLKDKYLNILQMLYDDELVSKYNFKFVAVIESNTSFINAIDDYAEYYAKVQVYTGEFFTTKKPQVCCCFVDEVGNEIGYIFKYSNVDFINLDNRQVFDFYLKHLSVVKALHNNMPKLTLKDYDFSKITNSYDNFIQFLSTLSYANNELDNLELLLCNTIKYLEKIYNIDMDYRKKDVRAYLIEELSDIFVTQSEKVNLDDELLIFMKSIIANIMDAYNENEDRKLCEIFAFLVSKHKN